MIYVAEDIISAAAIFDMAKGVDFDISTDKVEGVSKVDGGNHLEGFVEFIEGCGRIRRVKG